MMLLQKIEFWLFSVPALVVAICGIAHSRATSGLWARGAGSAARWAIGALEGHTRQRRGVFWRSGARQQACNSKRGASTNAVRNRQCRVGIRNGSGNEVR